MANIKQRLGLGGGMPAGMGGAAVAQPSIGGNLNTSFSAGASATGPALVLIGIVAVLVIDYVWTRGQQGGRA